jgi:TolB-like protein/Tfp pilus assembly protein PilF
MYTDMVGYTALGQRNESLSLALVEEQRKLVRPILSKHNGREVKTIGDAFLIEFASALDATRCAYDIQRATRELNFSLPEERRLHLRIGVHLGDVVETEGDVSGDAVNVASRIESLAEDGGVCLTRQVYDHVHNKFEVPMTSLGTKPLKNVIEPMEVFKMEMPWQTTREDSGTAPDAKRIAVLPFTNISPDPEDEYLADGMTEELIDRLSQVKELKVIARTSVMGYKKKEKKAYEIGKELGVGTLVEGSVRKSANKVRVTVQLIAANTEEHLWSSRYDKDLNDIFAIQSEIAENVTKELRVQLVDSERRTLEARPTESTEAYTLYLKGRYYWNERTKPSIEKGIEYLRKAIQLDPNFGLAYSDLADAYVMLVDYEIIPADEGMDMVQENATMALKIDPKLSQPHAALAFVHQRSFRRADTEKELERAIALNPNNVTARHWHALDLVLQGKVDSAIAEWRKAKELDPLSLIVGSNLGLALVRTGRKEEGFAMLRGVIELNDAFVVGHRLLAWAYVIARMEAEAVDEAKKLVSIEEREDNTALLAMMYAYAGRIEESNVILDRLLDSRATRYVDPFVISQIYGSLGDEINALKWLERAVNEKSAGVAYVRVFPTFDSLRNNPRFLALLKQMGLTAD